jgi:hypothetical protein
MGKAFDFVCRNIEKIIIILAMENLYRQAGQMLYPYGGSSLMSIAGLFLPPIVG